MDWRRVALAFLVITITRHSIAHAAQIPQQLPTSTPAIASTVQIECASESIIVHISTEGNTDFHGLVYPRGLSKNSSCLQEYKSQPAPITYNLPLRSCNTMPTELLLANSPVSIGSSNYDSCFIARAWIEIIRKAQSEVEMVSIFVIFDL